jgi:hypothetical protein
MQFSTVCPCPASPTGFVEVADELDDLGAVELMSAAELLASPYVRPLSAREAAAAWLAASLPVRVEELDR